MTNQSQTSLVLRKTCVAALALCVSLAPISGAYAQFNTNHKLAVTQWQAPHVAPTIDGSTSDPAWLDGFDFRMEDGAPLSAATMRGVADTNNLYLAFSSEDNTCDEDTEAGCVLEDFPLFGLDDMIVVAFNVDGTNTGYRRLHIQPCFDATPAKNKCPVNGPSAPGGQAANITYWRGTWNGSVMSWGAALPLPPGLSARTASAVTLTGPSDHPSSGRWTTELQIPRGGPDFPFPTVGNFGLFVDVISTNSALDSATQYSWPTTQQIGSADGTSVAAAINSTLDPSKWGVATLNGQGFTPGVQLVGFGSNQVDQSKINLLAGSVNEFHATLANGGASVGSPTTATNVRATFRIANWGLPSPWAVITTTPVGDRSNPTVPVSLTAREYRTRYTGDWVLSAAERLNYAAPNDHQCIQVTLTADAGVPINNPLYQFNMDFAVINSPFNSQPTINMVGAQKITGKSWPSVILREQFYNMDPRIGWKSKFGGAERVAENVWRVKANRKRINQLKTSVLAGDGLELPNDHYRLSPEGEGFVKIGVKPGSIVTLLNEGSLIYDGQEVSPLGVSLDKRSLRGEKMTEILGQLPRATFSRVLDTSSKDRNTTRPGAIIGSFDGFKTSFLVGAATTLKVPEDTDTLVLSIANTEQRAFKFDGKGFDIQVIATPVEKYMIDTNPALAQRLPKGQHVLPLGSNLPTYVVRGELETGKFIRIGDKIYKSRIPYGSFGSYIRQVN
jgi:hypothetical protein